MLEEDNEENPYGMKSSWFSNQIEDILAVSKMTANPQARATQGAITERSQEHSPSQLIMKELGESIQGNEDTFEALAKMRLK